MPAQAQNHIHLDADIGGAPENAPTNTYTALTPEIKLSRAHMGIEWAVDGTRMVHRVTSAGSTVVARGQRYRLKVTRAQLTALQGDEGNDVSFVNHFHCDDGEDHTAYVESSVVFRIAEIQSREHATLATYYVTIEVQVS
jgi:hypothetical protein